MRRLPSSVAANTATPASLTRKVIAAALVCHAGRVSGLGSRLESQAQFSIPWEGR